MTLKKLKDVLFKQYSISILLIPISIYFLAFFSPISSKLHNNIFYILVLIPCVFWVNKKQLIALLRSRIVLLTVIFTSYLALRSLFYHPFDFSDVKDPFRHLISFWLFFSVVVHLFQHVNFTVRMRAVAYWATVWGIGNAILYYTQYSFPGRMPFNGPTDHPIIGACVYAAFALIVLFSPHHSRIVSFVCFSSLASLVLFSQSRGPLLALTVAVIVALLWQSRKWLVVLPVMFWTGFAFAHQQGWITFSRLFKATSSYRFQIWQQVFENSLVQKSWLFGQSLLADQSVTVGSITFQHPHSGYVSTYFHGGIIALLILIALMLVAGWFVFRMRAEEGGRLAVALYVFGGLIVATDTHKMLDGPGALWLYFWLPLAFIAAKELNLYSNQATDSSQVPPD